MLENCELPNGTPLGSLSGVKQPGEAAALHLTDGRNFIFMEAFDPENPDEPLFTVPGFDHNNLALVTCDLAQPESGVTVRGLITPVRGPSA